MQTLYASTVASTGLNLRHCSRNCAAKASKTTTLLPSMTLGRSRLSSPSTTRKQRFVALAKRHDSNDNVTSHVVFRSASGELTTSQAPFLEPFVRSFILGVGAGALLEGSHVALQVMAGTFPGVSNFSPLLVADHVTAFTSWICLYAVEAVAIMAVLNRFNWNAEEAASDLSTLKTLPQKMLPMQLRSIFKPLSSLRTKLRTAFLSAATSSSLDTPATASTSVDMVTSLDSSNAAFTSFDSGGGSIDGPPTSGTSTTAKSPNPVTPHVSRSPKGAAGTILPGPRRKESGGGPSPPTKEPEEKQEPRHAQHEKRRKELRDRQGYLTNMWYAVAISERVEVNKPYQVQLCGKEMVVWRSEDDTLSCIDNTCPHRGAPLHQGWVENKGGHNCVVCPYHGWAMDGTGNLHDVPAAENKGEWPKRSLSDSYPVEEKGGFVWLFYGSKTLPADARPPIPFTPELEDPTWAAVYEEIEFDCNHFGVFENSFDFSHIHYLHGNSFGNSEKPEVRDIECSSDAHSVSAKFTIHNKPANAFWALFQVPEVHVTAKAFLPSSSYVEFTLGGGLSFVTFVNTVPISATKTVNRFALVRKLKSDRTGIFNWKAWDFMAKDAMLKIQNEDKAMIEQIDYNQLPVEFSVRADLPQVLFRKLRQQWVDLGYVVLTEQERPPYTVTNRDM